MDYAAEAGQVQPVDGLLPQRQQQILDYKHDMRDDTCSKLLISESSILHALIDLPTVQDKTLRLASKCGITPVQYSVTSVNSHMVCFARQIAVF